MSGMNEQKKGFAAHCFAFLFRVEPSNGTKGSA